MIKIGISFELYQTFYTHCLHEIVECLKEENYVWHIINSQTEVWADSDGNELFSEKKYNSKDYFDLISNNHYAVFVKIQAYLSSVAFNEIHTIEDFRNSDCQLIILICDNTWCDIYIKESKILDKMYQNLVKKNFGNLKYIYDNNNERTKLDVL